MRLAQDVEEGHLAHRRRDPPVVRRGGERVAAAHRGAEGGDPLGVDAGQRAGEADRRAPVLELARGVEEVRLAAAVAEAAMVEEERGDARRGEALGERPEPVAARPREAVRHDDDRRRGLAARRRIEPGRAGVAADPEGEVVAAPRSHTTGAGGRNVRLRRAALSAASVRSPISS